jgi:hypothetical protein
MVRKSSSDAPPPPVAAPGKQFPVSVKKGTTRAWMGNQVEIDVLDGIIAHLTRECSGYVHNQQVVEVTPGSFEKETEGVDPRWVRTIVDMSRSNRRIGHSHCGDSVRIILTKIPHQNSASDFIASSG